MSELTDLEICRRIAEIEGLMFCTGNRYARIEVWKDGRVFKYEKYNPLTDDALCFRLMIKYGVWRWSNPRKGKFNACIKDAQGWISGESLNKAICLAIIGSGEVSYG